MSIGGELSAAYLFKNAPERARIGAIKRKRHKTYIDVERASAPL
jgi:hypothetical protein